MYIKPDKSLSFRLSVTLIFLLSAVGTILTGCEEPYDLSQPDMDPVLVVNGQITNQFKPHEVVLTQTGDYRNGGDFPPATGAEVSIVSGAERFPLREAEPGRYLTDSLAGVPGNVYTLTINWNNTMYTASDTMGAIPEPFESVSFGEDSDFRRFEYRRHQFGFPIPNYWELTLEPKDSTQYATDISQLAQQIGVRAVEPGTYHFAFYTHPNIEVNGLLNFTESHFYGFRTGRKVTQRRFSLSHSYYRFLRSLFMETEWRGTLFDSTPANVQGNVSHGGLGFFSATSVRSISFVLQ